MRKKILVIILGLAILAAAVPYAYAAASKAPDVSQEQLQILELRKQIVDKSVAAGTITADQGKLMKDRIGQMEVYVKEGKSLPGGFGFGRGPGKGGFAGRSGFCGGGAGGFGAGCRNQQSPPTTADQSN